MSQSGFEPSLLDDDEYESSDDETAVPIDNLRLQESDGSDSDTETNAATEAGAVSLGAAGYLFEPIGSDHSDGSEDEATSFVPIEANVGEKAGNTEWCSCGSCRNMGREIDSLCCKEVGVIPADSYEGIVHIHVFFIYKLLHFWVEPRVA